MGMFGFLKKKEDVVPSAPDMSGPDSKIAPSLDLPAINMDSMDIPPTPDKGTQMEGIPLDPPNQLPPEQPVQNQQPSTEPQMNVAMPDYRFSTPEMPKEPEVDPVETNVEPEIQPVEEQQPEVQSVEEQQPEESEIQPVEEQQPGIQPAEEQQPEESEIQPVEKQPSEESDIQPPEEQQPEEPQNIEEPIEPLNFGSNLPEKPEDESEDSLPGMPRFEEIKNTPSEEFTEPADVGDAFEEPSEQELFSADKEIMPSRRVINRALFINVEEFKNVAGIINGLSDDAKMAEETLFRIKDVALGREKVFDKWQGDLEQVERELIQLDKLLFNV